MHAPVVRGHWRAHAVRCFQIGARLRQVQTCSADKTKALLCPSAPPDRFWPGAACHPWILPACSAAAFASAFTKKKGVAYSLAGCYFFPLALLPDQTATSLSSPSVALLHCIYISRGLNSPLFSVKHLAQPLPGPWNPEALPVFRLPRTHDDSCSRPAQSGSQPNPK